MPTGRIRDTRQPREVGNLLRIYANNADVPFATRLAVVRATWDPSEPRRIAIRGANDEWRIGYVADDETRGGHDETRGGHVQVYSLNDHNTPFRTLAVLPRWREVDVYTRGIETGLRLAEIMRDAVERGDMRPRRYRPRVDGMF